MKLTRSPWEIEAELEVLMLRIDELHYLRSARDCPEELRSSYAIEACIGAAMVNALSYTLGETASPTTRSPRFNLGRR